MIRRLLCHLGWHRWHPEPRQHRMAAPECVGRYCIHCEARQRWWPHPSMPMLSGWDYDWTPKPKAPSPYPPPVIKEKPPADAEAAHS